MRALDRGLPSTGQHCWKLPPRPKKPGARRHSGNARKTIGAGMPAGGALRSRDPPVVLSRPRRVSEEAARGSATPCRSARARTPPPSR